jgi:ABC-type lipoprotein release transport system permease subunit
VTEQELQALDPKLPLFQVQTIEARVDDALRQERLVATGTAVGVPLALGSLRAAGSFLYGVAPSHPAILAIVLTVVTVVALAAALVPARGAARTEVWNALRSE